MITSVLLVSLSKLKIIIRKYGDYFVGVEIFTIIANLEASPFV